MTELLKVSNSITSFEIAELTGKRHDNVLRDIRSLLEQGVDPLNFECSLVDKELLNGGFKKISCYNLTKKGSLILASGYNALLREKIIDRWEELELANGVLATPNFSNPAEAARAWADQFEARQLAEKKVELQQPKVEFYDTVTTSESTIDMAAVAKVLNMGIGRNNLFRFLRNSNILRSNNEPYQKYIDMGWFKVVETPFNMPDGKVRVGLKTVVFQKGLDEIRKFLIKSGYAA